MIKIAVVDDELDMLKEITDGISKQFEKRKIKITIDKFTNGAQLIKALESNRLFDVVFLDIELPDKLGLEIAKLLKETYRNIIIAFVTSIDISVVLFLSKYAVFIYNLHTMILISMFSTTVIFFLAPIENPNKPLSESETVKNARKSKVLSVILCLMIIVLYRINKEISLTLLLTYFSAAAAMIIEYLRKGGTVHEDQKENG